LAGEQPFLPFDYGADHPPQPQPSVVSGGSMQSR
jgi:hypothetical protein